MEEHLEPYHSDIFDKLKRNRAIRHRSRPAEALFFQLDFDDTGAFIEVVNARGDSVEAPYECYSGPTRDVLKMLDGLRHQKGFRIDWGAPAPDRLYLAENEHLTWQLARCDNLVGPDMAPIRFAEGDGRIAVRIDMKRKYMTAEVGLVHPENGDGRPRLVSETHALCGDTLYRIDPVGENYSDLPLFETRILPKNLEKYLSLLYSYFQNVSVRYEDYRVETGPAKTARPTLVFEKVDSDKTLYLRISTSLSGFEPDFFDHYDVTRIVGLNELEKKMVVREVSQEPLYEALAEVDRLLKKHSKQAKTGDYFVEDNLFVIQEALARPFIHKDLPELITRYVMMGAERLKSYKVKPVKPRLDLNLSHGIDFLQGGAHLDIEGEKISLFDALSQYNKNSYIRLSDGTHAILNREYIDKLSRIFKKKKDKVKISFFDLPIVEELIDEKIAEASFQRSREIFQGFNTIQRTKPRLPEIRAELRSYQKQGFKWLKYLHQNGLGGCLADDMGLGKTIQTLALLGSIYPAETRPSLVVMPKSLLFNWENEIQKFTPQLTCAVYHGPDRDLKAARSKQLILTTYAMMRNDIEAFKEIPFAYVVLDESQNIKNLQSQTSRAAMLLQADHRLALSGTPVENNLGELYSLFRFLNPAMFGSVEDFTKFYAVPIQKEDDKEALRELKKKIYPFILRRLKRDVLKDLPDKIEQTLYVDMSDEQTEFYEERRRFYYDMIQSQIAQSGFNKSRFFILQAMTELRQIASVPEAKTENAIRSPKREILMEQIEEVVANRHKVLVFASFLHSLECIGEDLERLGIDYQVMTGATRDRQELVNRFQKDPDCKAFLMTLKTGGYGINLTAADYIFIYDPWWNQASENQAVDRTHRIGQDKTVFSYKLIARGSIEEKILELQKIKSKLFEDLISSDGAAIKSLSEDDIQFILG
ncbi:MAG: DEAD/DEAH box helicase [Desulfococcaceae bacterium]